MKKLILIFISIFSFNMHSNAHGFATINGYGDAFVFDEMGVTFSVYPDGEFDFYIPPSQAVCVNTGYVSVSFNSGYDYNPFVQYDDFGAVSQVENIPVWYDYYGRVSQIGDVRVNYRDRRVCQVGGLYVFYNYHGHYTHHTGFINTWNPYFVYRPFYTSFVRPSAALCFVSYSPYRQYYRPVRYSYYRPYGHNVRPHHVTIGHTYRPSGRGIAHSRYTQTPARGERKVVRTRRTVTTADVGARPTSATRANVSSRTVNPSSTVNRSRTATKPSTVNRTRTTRTVSRSDGRSSKPATSTQRQVTTRTQTKPTSTRSVNTSSRSNKPTVAQSRSTKPTSTGRTVRSTKPVSTARTSSRSGATAKPSAVSRTRSTSKPSVSSSSRSTSRVSTSNGRSAKPVTRSSSGSSSKKPAIRGKR